MKLFNSLSIVALISIAYAMPEHDHSDSGDAANAVEGSTPAEASPEGGPDDRFFGFGHGGGLVNANANVANLARAHASVLGPNGVANAGVGVAGLAGVGASVLGPHGIADVRAHILGLPIGVNVGGLGWGGYPGYGGYPPYGGAPPYGGYPPYGTPPPYGSPPPYGAPPPYGGYPAY